MSDLPPANPLRTVAAAFTYRNFRVLWLGAFTSSIGTWMQSVAQSWLVLTITGSAFYLGLDSFIGQLPIMLFTLVGGVIADRQDRRKLLIGSQVVQMASAFALAGLVVFDVARIGYILALSFLTGLAQAFGGPAYQALLPALVDKRDIPNAVALNSIQFNLARVIGPLAAGAAMAALGSAACFGLNGLSFLAVVVALALVRLPRTEPAPPRPILLELREGLRYTRATPRLVPLMVLAFATTSLGTSLLVLLPVFAQQVFHGGVSDFSRMMAFSGAGAVTGAIAFAVIGRSERIERTALWVQVVLAGLLVAFAWSHVMWLNELLLFAAGVALLIVYSSLTSLVQMMVSNEMRGRVMSLYLLAFRGGMPLGALVSGSVASAVSAPAALTVNGVLLGIVALLFLRRGRTAEGAGSRLPV